MHICRKTGIFKLADVRISICKMAGNKVNTKTKGREDKGKVNKCVTQNNDDNEDLDFALLRKPVHTSVTGFAQARKIFDVATEELKDLLSNECDLLYECKVCRNIFRSLANLISHKRVYCQEKFNTSVHGHFIKSVSTLEEVLKIKHTELGYQAALKNKNKNVINTNMDEVDRIPLSKDLTAVVENIAMAKGTDNKEETQVVLQKIPSSSVAVFQNINSSEDSNDNMRAQIKELDQILCQERAVLQSDGQFTIESTKLPDKSENQYVIQISDDEDNDGDNLKCKICDNQFSTQKTLRFHMKYKHLESRLVYPCPDCVEIFSTSWSVYRHLFKVHRKSAAQIRRLRESIQAKAFRMNNPPAFYEKRKNNMKTAAAQKITEEERLDQENQAWMDNMEGDGEVPRCGGCGRTFERRAALAAHTHTCQPRSRALRRPEAKIRKDYDKGPAAGKDASESNKLASEETQPAAKSQTENENAEDAEDKDQSPMDFEEDQKSNDSAESPEKPEVVPQLEPTLAVVLPFALQAEKSNLAAFKTRIQPEIELNKLTCKKCDLKLTSLSLLYEHMADHFKWLRYACKLCNFKNYNFEKLPEHVKLVHKLKGDTDFYFSTVKAIDGTEAMIMSKCLTDEANAATDEANDANESPESRRGSRCSSDSSRLSDDSSSSSYLKEVGSRKRKMRPTKNVIKRKREIESKDGGEDSKDVVSMDKVLKSIINDDSTNVKSFEENSSDFDEIEEKLPKRNASDTSISVASTRPVRKRTKPKNEDFEYDLSNLLKMEAQGYRDSQSVANNKTTQVKQQKKPPEIISPEVNNTVNMKDYCGALFTLSKKTADNGRAHLKNSIFSLVRDIRPMDMFLRPQIPRIFGRGDKLSPKKEISDDLKESSPSKTSKPAEIINIKDLKPKEHEEITMPEQDDVATLKKIENVCTKTSDIETPINDDAEENSTMFKIEDVKTLANCNENSLHKENEGANILKKPDNSVCLTNNQLKSLKVPAVVPFKFRRQSLDIIKKNPIINKNLSDFTKAGMKTKILVIKPIRSKDSSNTVTTPLKYQTIKLKDPNRGTTSEEKSEQVVVVKVPKVDRSMSRTVPEVNDKPEQIAPIENTVKQADKTNEDNEITQTEDVELPCNEVENKCNDVSLVSESMNSENVGDSVIKTVTDKNVVTETSSIDK